MAKLDTKLKIESWDEQPYRELPDGSRFTRAEVTLSGTDDAVTAATFEGLMFYRPDGTSSYATLMRIEATLDGRAGTFVLRGTGTYDGTTARGDSEVVPGSATGDLAGLTGAATSASTQADYPHMPLTLEYEPA
ncbi:DUF3224 domain-containing protein [Plantactinospora siamensis]|uniref:DUF3224 domain-containing protein n=1 Tax=Plantactinospora siamensis TaxID=555372 RepID=A0ABV6NPR9_9ACTN